MGGNSSRERQVVEAPLPALLPEPWKIFEEGGGWTDQYRSKLLDDIKEQKQIGNLRSVGIIFFGKIAAGKSSFINSVACIDSGRITDRAHVGMWKTSMTKKFMRFLPDGRFSDNFRLMDTIGMEDGEKGLRKDDIRHLLEGNIKANYTFTSESIDKESNFYNFDPKEVDQFQCAVIVLDASMLINGETTDETYTKIDKLQEQIRKFELPKIVLLTKVDKACPGVRLADLYRSRILNETVKMACEMTGVPRMHIFPIKNYESEAGLDTNMDILILLALRQMVRSANDYLKMVENQKVDSKSFFAGNASE